MTPLTQTIVHGQIEGVKGNCLQATIASMLDLPINEVPHFGLIQSRKERLHTMDKFFRERGYKMKGFASASDLNDPKLTKGIDGYVMVSGISPRKIPHVVIFKNGRMVHDVHPSREGLKSVLGFYVIEPSMKESNYLFS